VPFPRLLRGNVLEDGQDRSFNEHAQHRVRIRANLTRHGDRLGQDMHRVGPVGGDALNPPDKCVDSRERSLWHRHSIARRVVARQEYGGQACHSRCPFFSAIGVRDEERARAGIRDKICFQ
jgi:hypothetical protein